MKPDDLAAAGCPYVRQLTFATWWNLRYVHVIAIKDALQKAGRLLSNQGCSTLR